MTLRIIWNPDPVEPSRKGGLFRNKQQLRQNAVIFALPIQIKLVLENAAVYEAVTTIPRKGMGKMLKSCGLAKDKKQSVELSGIVTFIDATTHKQVKQISISESDEVMIKTIDNLLN